MGTHTWDLFYLNRLYIVLGTRTVMCELGEDTVHSALKVGCTGREGCEGGGT